MGDDEPVLQDAEISTHREVARAASERGEVLLRRRVGDGALELRVNGVFVMDNLRTDTDRRLAEAGLQMLAASKPTSAGDWTVLVAGLGLGFTLAEVLADVRVSAVTVAEIESELVRWHRQNLVPDSPVQDTRVQVEVGDVRRVVTELPETSVDLVLLDVDNGPDFLVYDANAAVYREPFLIACRRALRRGGLVAIWSATASSALRAALDSVFGDCVEHAVPVVLGQRETTYHLFLAPRSR